MVLVIFQTIKLFNYIKATLMNIKGFRLLMVIAFTSISVSAFSSTQTLLDGLRGTTLINGAKIQVEDQHYEYMVANPSTYQDYFVNNSSKVNVRFYYDQSNTLNYYSTSWSCTVTYTLRLYSASGSYYDYTNQQLMVEYDPSGEYQTEIVKNYADGGYKAELTITNISYTGSISSAPSDLLLDVELSTNRYYKIDIFSTPTVGVCATTFQQPGSLSISWPFVYGAESYDVEWVFVDIPDITNIAPDKYEVDFSNAYRINTTNNWFRIPMGYSSGAIVYRVRGKGYYYYSSYVGSLEQTLWSYDAGGSAYIEDIPTAHKYYFSGLEEEKNWQYSVSYTEQGNYQEQIQYVDGLGHVRQSIGFINGKEKKAIVGEAIYDYQGRVAAEILPSSTPNVGLIFYDDFNGGFDKDDIDGDLKLYQPNVMSTSDGSGNFYSDQNINQQGLEAWLPNADGYPYRRTIYRSDGTGRVRGSFLAGSDFKAGSNHGVMVYSCNADQNQIDMLFGNEVGIAENYHKQVMVDGNGQISYSISDLHGRVIATSIDGGNADDLLSVDNAPGSSTVNNDLMLLNEVQDNASVTTYQVFATSSAQVFHFAYALTGTSGAVECMPNNITAKYNVSIYAFDEYGDEVDANGPIVAGTHYEFNDESDVSIIYFDFTPPGPGEYTIVKRVTLSDSPVEWIEANFANLQTCVEVPELMPSPCLFECENVCRMKYVLGLDAQGDTIYIDEEGVVISASAAWLLMVNCVEESCGEQPIMSESPCEFTRRLMQHDMSPGGQYFDNLPAHLVSDGNGGLMISQYYYNETTGYENRYIDYMMEYIDAQSSTDILDDVINASGGGYSFTTWDEVREAWDDEEASWNSQTYGAFWDELLLPFHPEYCQYEQHCLYTCGSGGDNGMAPSDQYYLDMVNCNDDATAILEGYFNPATINPDCNSSGVSSDNVAYVCIDNTLITGEIDPLIECKEDFCEGHSYLETMATYLTKFFYEPNYDVFYSIWYVIEDPDDITGGGTGVAQSTEDFFQTLHGANGLIGTGTGKMSKFAYFRSVYQFFREYMLYFNGKEKCSNSLLETDNYGVVTSPTTYAGMSVRYGTNFIFEALGDACPAKNGSELMYGFMSNISTYMSESTVCNTNCEDAAAGWIFELSNCTLSGSYTTQEVQGWLIEICENSCGEANGFWGDDEGTYAVGPNNPKDWYTFEDVVTNCYDAGCEVPVHLYSSNQATCSCDIFTNFYEDNGNDPATVASELNDLFGTTFSDADVSRWVSECSSSNPSWTTLQSYGFPTYLSCIDFDPEEPTLEELITDCENQNQIEADFQEQLLYNQLLNQQLPLTIAAYNEMALNNIEGREHFAVYYQSNEFLYTLYYYDQAGNLVRTVPPEGVHPIAVLDLPQVQNHRNNPTSYPSVYPDHSMVTSYEYNSYQLVTEQTIPDGMKKLAANSYELGSTTKYFYDDKGRIIVSQNKKQQTGINDYRRYSYTVYDDFGRIKETGEASLYDDPSVIGQETDPYDETRSFMVYKDNDATTDDYYTTWYSTISTGSLSQVMRTWYDESLSGIGVQFGTSGQENIRNRVCSVTKDENNDGTYESAIHYSYDVHGNAKTVLCDIPELDPLWMQITRTDYTYDLLSGNVKQLVYQSGKFDQFIHRYSYDVNNRLRAVFTSRDGFVWTQDAKQLYNSMGTMARLELGQYHVQGLDYVYTINGWLKAINSVTLKPNRDPGLDGNGRISGSTNNLDACFGEDAFGFALTYYKQDPADVVICNSTYSGRNPEFEPTIDNGSDYYTAVYDLYNGNIAAWNTGLYNTQEQMMDLQGYVFRYDKLNRLKEATMYNDPDILDYNEWGSGSGESQAYHSLYTYDFNGNILSLLRNGEVGNFNMDNLSYGYTTNGLSGYNDRRMNNILLGYNDNPLYTSNYTTDIDDPNQGTFDETDDATWNFMYDEVGNLIQDKAEQINSIEWNVYGKVKKVTRTSGSTKSDLEFVYDPMGNRICKIVKPRTGGVLSTQPAWTYTWYSLDAQGQTMATYEQTYTPLGGSSYRANYDLQETYLYGSSRLGVLNDVAAAEKTRNFTATIDGSSGLFTGISWGIATVVMACTEHCVNAYSQTLAHKQYEISNHLGNVQTTISDRRIAVPYGSNLDHYIADVISSTDYYPFGSAMPGRNSNSDNYRFGFNGKEKVDELFESSGSAYDFGARLYDSRLGRWMACDPMAVKYPGYSPYHFGYCDPIAVIDPDGRENVIVVGVQGGPDEYMTRENNFYGRAVHHAKKLSSSGEQTTVLINRNDIADRIRGERYIFKLRESGVKIVYYSSEQDIFNYVNNRSKMDESGKEYTEDVTDLVFLNHSNSNELLLGGGLSIASDDVANFLRESFSPNAVVNLGSCYTGLKGGIAQAFAVSVGIEAVGPSGSCSYAGDIEGPYTNNGTNVYSPNNPKPTESIEERSVVFRESVDEAIKKWKLERAKFAKDETTGNKAIDTNVPMF
ncbi:MAG: hypothetical protein A2W94_07175 [Bacteroidetes bacterium GWE2_42_42]|nr:MAG: hypothetical protein A2W94_07175 [Bacteroidetes bacterium GWE2_42_42]